MKTKILTAAFLIVFNFLNAQGLNVVSDPKWSLVAGMSDEFDGTEINTDKWQGILGFEDFMCAPNGECIFNDAAKAFQRSSLPNENIIVDNGIATILVRNIPTDVTIKCQTEVSPGNCTGENWLTQNVDFTVGTLISKNVIKYGYFELKFRMPAPAIDATFRPFGPNFWLYKQSSSTVNNSCYSEIDFFEITDGQTRAYTTNTHFTYAGDPDCGLNINGNLHDDNNANPLQGQFGPTNITGDEWHTAGGHWTPNRLDFYLDGELIKTNHNDWVSSLDDMCIIIGINAPLGGTSLTSSAVQYPYAYDLDYIRVYQLDPDCGSDEITYCGTPPDVTDGYTVQKNITFGGNACGGANFTSITNSLYANEYILLDENTTLGGGSGTLYLTVNDCYNP